MTDKIPDYIETLVKGGLDPCSEPWSTLKKNSFCFQGLPEGSNSIEKAIMGGGGIVLRMHQKYPWSDQRHWYAWLEQKQIKQMKIFQQINNNDYKDLSKWVPPGT